ncbi:hypothetical protein SARC_06347, partial [Sphaeroforma arctica JP610]
MMSLLALINPSTDCHVFFRGSDGPGDYFLGGGNLDYSLKKVYTAVDKRYLGIAHHGFADAFVALEEFVDQTILKQCGSLVNAILIDFRVACEFRLAACPPLVP